MQACSAFDPGILCRRQQARFLELLESSGTNTFQRDGQLSFCRGMESWLIRGGGDVGAINKYRSDVFVDLFPTITTHTTEEVCPSSTGATFVSVGCGRERVRSAEAGTAGAGMVDEAPGLRTALSSVFYRAGHSTLPLTYSQVLHPVQTSVVPPPHPYAKNSHRKHGIYDCYRTQCIQSSLS